MNISLILKIAEIVGTALGVLAFALVTYWRMKEKRLEERMGLIENPERCGEHAARLRALEERMDDNHEEHVRMLDQISRLAVEVARISRNGGGK